MNSVTNDLKMLVRDAGAVLANAGGAAEDGVSALRGRLRRSLRQTRRRLDDAREFARDRIETADDYVKAHPYHTIGVALALGALLGALLGRRR